jgi:prolyl-tRNA synthetase
MKFLLEKNKDISKWYISAMIKSEIAIYGPSKGTIILLPYGYKIWNLIQKNLSKKLKKEKIQELKMPILIPESLFKKEKKHLLGFNQESLIASKNLNQNLKEKTIISPTSEVLFMFFFEKILKSYKQLPFSFYQWSDVVRIEKTNKPLLRLNNFLWQEGHSLHTSEKEAKNYCKKILFIYNNLIKKKLLISTILGKKTEKEKFAGAKDTYTIEAFLPDGNFLQIATTHNFGTSFSKAFNLKYLNKENKFEFANQTSFGISIRLLGGNILMHGDDKGIILPPDVSPWKIIIIPISKTKEIENELINIEKKLKKHKLSYFIDLDFEKKPGNKFYYYEMKGIPIRIEIGEKEILRKKIIILNRFTKKKEEVNISEMIEKIKINLKIIKDKLFSQSNQLLNKSLKKIYSLKKFKEKDNQNNKIYYFAPFCNQINCEEEIQKKTFLSSRCIPLFEKETNLPCFSCEKKKTKWTYFGKTY